jgi:polyisoprenoid-binding protein YceI
MTVKAICFAFFLFLLFPPAFAEDAAPPAKPSLDVSKASKGAYTVDKSHAFILFSVSHLGYSMYHGRFNGFDAQLNFDPAAPEKSTLDVAIDMSSADSNNPKMLEQYKSDKFFNVVKYPTATFKATKVTKMGQDSGKIVGDLSMMGVTKPVTLDVKFHGYGIGPFSKQETLGFSATGVIKRSEWGITAFLPMIGDDVRIDIEAEFNYNAGKPSDAAETYKE